MKRELREGDVVEVFDNPITDEGSEGKAYLLAPLTDVDPATGYQDWLVTFLDDVDRYYNHGECYGEYRRTVHPRHRR